jgi:hypothetical protein
MGLDDVEAGVRCVRDEVVARLEAVGVATTPEDSPDGLARLLEAVEDFERSVEWRGGDRMVDEPVGTRAPEQPDDPSFVLPRRVPGEPIESFIDRIADARDRGR